MSLYSVRTPLKSAIISGEQTNFVPSTRPQPYQAKHLVGSHSMEHAPTTSANKARNGSTDINHRILRASLTTAYAGARMNMHDDGCRHHMHFAHRLCRSLQRHTIQAEKAALAIAHTQPIYSLSNSMSKLPKCTNIKTGCKSSSQRPLNARSVWFGPLRSKAIASENGATGHRETSAATAHPVPYCRAPHNAAS